MSRNFRFVDVYEGKKITTEFKDEMRRCQLQEAKDLIPLLDFPLSRVLMGMQGGGGEGGSREVGGRSHSSLRFSTLKSLNGDAGEAGKREVGGRRKVS